jgi:hypothetical protein
MDIQPQHGIIIDIMRKLVHLDHCGPEGHDSLLQMAAYVDGIIHRMEDTDPPEKEWQ